MKKISKILSIVLVLAMVMGFALVASAEDASATISFADKSIRTSFSSTQQVWEANGIVFTNDKAASTNAVADYANPVRLYKGSNVTIEYPSMTKIVITANSGSYADVLVNTPNDANVTATKDGSVVTFEFASPVDSFALTTLTAQTRINELSVYAAASEEEPEVTNFYVTGSTEVFGNWAELNEAGLMTKGEDGLYTKVFENVPAADYELKVNVGNWGTSWGNGNDNYKFTVDAVSTVTVTFNAENCTVSVAVVPNEVEPEPETPAIEDGEYVIYAPAFNKALSSEKTGYYNVGVDVVLTEGVLSGYGATEIWTVTNNDDGSITISQNGQNLALADQNSSMNLGETHDKWVLEDAGNGLFFVKNVGRENYMEWYAKYSNWSTYGIIYDDSVDLFALAFYAAVTEEEPEVTTNYYVTGSSEVFGNWAELNESGLMTKGEDGLYTKVYENVPAADYELKVNVGNWGTSWGNGNDNYKFTVDAVSTVTVTFDAEAGTVSVDVVPVEVIPDEPTIVDIATALAGADGEEFTVKGIVVCIDGKNVYVQDATGGICVRTNDQPADLTLGYTIVATGSKGAYNGLPQLSGSTYEVTEGEELSAKETTIDALTVEDVCTYVKLSGLTVTEVFDNDGVYTTPNVTLSDGTNTIQIYKAVVAKNEDGTWAIKVGDKVNVTAAVSIYARDENVTLQLRNTFEEEIELVVDENPGEGGEDDGETGGEVNPGAGDVSVAGLVVAMMAATAGVVVLKKKEF